jgi:hypothetical protein
MEYRNLGRTGVKVSQLCLGTMMFGRSTNEQDSVAGIPHGPHPGAYEAKPPSDRTEEVAVMLDCTRPLTPTADALSVEDGDYHRSFEG